MPKAKKLGSKQLLVQAAIKDAIQPVNGVQVNHCKNPVCKNFNVAFTGDNKDPNYKRSGSLVVAKPYGPLIDDEKLRGHPAIGRKGNSPPFIQCQACRETIPLKNNHAINEVMKLWSYHPDNHFCPNKDCKNNDVSIGTKGAYKKNGKTNAGTVRWLCNCCHKSFVERAKVRAPRSGEKPYRREDVISAVVNGCSFRRIEEMLRVHPSSIYHYIEKAYEACMRFNAARKPRLKEVLKKRGVIYFSTDRQDLLVNWSDRKDRNSIVVKAVCSVDTQTGYVYEYNVGIDDHSDAKKIHKESVYAGDVDKANIFRIHPQLFLPSDMDTERRINGYIEQELLKEKRVNPFITPTELAYLDAQLRPDVELPSSHLTEGTALPNDCLLLREDYQLYAHYFLLKDTFPEGAKIINSADQESGLRAAFMSAFGDQVNNNSAHLFYISLKKGSTREEREAASARTFKRIRKTKKTLQCDDTTARHALCVNAIKNFTQPIGKWRDLWGNHPLETKTEVYKKFSHQTYSPNQSIDEIADYLRVTSLHAVDNHFMRVRRRIAQLERGVPSASSERRIWYGKSFYRPDLVKKVSTILKTYLNYCEIPTIKYTPAQRLGIAKGPVRLRDILNS